MSFTTEQLKVELGHHAVHFYRDDADLADAVGQYLTDALGEPAVALVIATEPHVKAFDRRLEAVGTDVKGALESGRLIFLDAATTLAKLTVGAQIDGQAFDTEVGRVVRTAAEAGCAVRAYGEMVDLLWQAGDVSRAIELERLWNELIEELRFSLLCAYHSTTATAPEHEHALREVCRLHSTVSSTPGADALLSLQGACREVSREFRPGDDAPSAARRFLEEALHDSGRSRTLVDDARQVITELATNAVRHARSPLLISIHTQDSSVRLAVHDQSPAQPMLRHAAPDAASGRGLQIVAALSRNWGVETAPGGKTVWAQI